MTLLDRMARCVRCQRRDRAPDLTVCAACAADLVGRRVVVVHDDGTVVQPEWLRRLKARDMTDYGSAA